MTQEVMQFVGPLAGMFIAALVSYAVAIVVIKPNPGKSTEAALARLALQNLGIDRASWDTVIISYSNDVAMPLDALWETWADLENWPAWSTQHAAARWVAGDAWCVGSKFEETLATGFPFGRKIATQTVTECIPQRQVRWCKTQGGSKYCHIWSFYMLPNRRVRVTKTEVFQGTMFGLFKPIMMWRWQKQFQRSVNGLIEAAHRR